MERLTWWQDERHHSSSGKGSDPSAASGGTASETLTREQPDHRVRGWES